MECVGWCVVCLSNWLILFENYEFALHSFFGLLKRERVNRVHYRTRDEARADIFDYIESFYNRKRRHGYLGNVSPAIFESRSEGRYETVH